MIEQTYKLSMIPFEEQVRRNYEIPIVPASQYDKTLRTLSFELYNGEDRFTIPTEAVVYIFGMKPDGNAFQYQMTVEDNMAKIAMQTQMTTVAGCVTCEIVLFEENTAGPRIGSANFKLMVEKCAVGDDAEFSRSDMPVIQTLIFGGMVGDVLVKDANGVKWNSESLSTGYMRYDQYDPDRTGTVDSARDSETVDGHTVARNVLADEYSNAEIDTKVNAVNTRIDNQIGSYTVERNVLSGEYTNTEIDGKVQAVQDDVDALDSSAVKSVNTITPINGNVTLSKSDVGLGNVDNTSDLSKPISTATQSALDEKVDKVTGKGLSTNDFTNQWRNKLEGIEAGAEVNVQANWDQTIATADDYIKNKPSIPENTSDLVNDSGFITAALAPVQGVKGSAESAYRTGNVSISKENIGLGNVDNTSDVDKPISTAVQTALDGKQATLTFDSIPTAGSTNPVTSDGIATEISALNSNLSQKVSSVNSETPDTNGNVEIDATDIETSSGVAIKSVSGNPVAIADALQGKSLGANVTLEPIQSGSGDPSPTNIRPISGRTQVEITNKDSEDVVLDSVTVNLGQTVYGGTLDVTTGLLTVDKKSVDLGSLTWQTSVIQSLTRMLSNSIADIKHGTNNNYKANAISSCYTVSTVNMMYQVSKNGSFGVNSNAELMVLDTRYTDPSVFKTDMAGQTVCYELAAPLTIQLTPAQINLLTGTNIISTSADDLSVRYYATGQTGNVEGSLSFLLDKTANNETAVNTVSESIAPAETGTATQNYATGSYLMLNNRLCKVTAAIATGEQIIVGSNVQYTTVAEELAAILAQINA